MVGWQMVMSLSKLQEWWWTGMLQFMGSQRVRHSWETELIWLSLFKVCFYGISVASPVFFWLPFACNSFSNPSLSVNVFPLLEWIPGWTPCPTEPEEGPSIWGVDGHPPALSKLSGERSLWVLTRPRSESRDWAICVSYYEELLLYTHWLGDLPFLVMCTGNLEQEGDSGKVVALSPWKQMIV